MKLVRSIWQCPCDKVEKVESKYTHDFSTCSCGDFSVDGGLSYTRLVGHNLTRAIDFSVWEGEEDDG